MEQYNKDKLLGLNLPRASYAISGTDWAIEKGKDAPMIINLNSPGVFGDDWVSTYGTSLDSFLSIVDGFKILESVETVTVAGVYKDGFPNTKTENIWAKAEPNGEKPIQQIQYVVSGGNINEGRERVDDFGLLFNARGLCMRGPMMLSGYGRTKDMLPISPKENSERLNSEDVKLDRSLWKTGTVDLRWDERRNVWGGWQDIIVDHENKGLGTTVFSTNPDLDKGFPYIKGKLQDVWWVRQPDSLNNTNGKVEGQQTAEIMTHLKHKFFDESTDGSAKLETVFIIPHNDASEDPESCHPKGEERTLGDETTGDGLAIDIRSTVHFWKEDEVDGPIKFGNKRTDLGDKVSCVNEDACYFIGEMIFLDEGVTTCASRNSLTVNISEGEPPCEWVPAIRIDECELMGGHLGIMYGNDETIAQGLDSLCTQVNAWSENLATAIKSNDAAAMGLAAEACDSVVNLAGGVNGGFDALSAYLMETIVELIDEIGAVIEGLIVAINLALASCGCESSVVFAPEFVSGGGHFAPQVSATPCASTIGNIPKFECSQCVGVNLQAPCSEKPDNTYHVGGGCAGGNFPTPNYEDSGLCQAN
jgi:hypothetical protein